MKLLPRGYTLIELLIVVVIVAILTTLVLVVYRNLTRGARDSERQAEITEIAKALELNSTADGYQPLKVAWFSSGIIPDDPRPARVYCIYHSTTNSTPAIKPTAIWTTTCPAAPSTVYIGNPLSTTVPLANSISFTVCASLEKTTNTVFCAYSNQ